MEKYHEALKKMLRIVDLLKTNYLKESDVEDISDDCMGEFVHEIYIDSFEEIFLEIENMEIRNMKWENIKDLKLNKIISFVYLSLMDFPNNKFEIKTVPAKEFFCSVRGLTYGAYVIHHSHVSGQIIGYAHDFCNKKIRKNQTLILLFAHNLFSFCFFFVVKGVSLFVWRPKQFNIGGTNLTNVQYANIGNQVKFIDTIKYFQQSLSALTKNVNEMEQKNIKNSCRKFTEKNERYF